MAIDSEDSVSLPKPPPPRPAARDAAIEAAMRRFDGGGPETPVRARPSAGGVAGLGIAYGGLILLKAFIPENISQAREISIDFRVLGFTLLVSVLTGLIFGLAPAIRRARVRRWTRSTPA